jgi:hypothetical protein
MLKAVITPHLKLSMPCHCVTKMLSRTRDVEE